MRAAAGRLKSRGFKVRTTTIPDIGETKIFIRRNDIEVKIEVNFVMRGTVHPVQSISLTHKAQAILLADITLPIASREDVYAGKLVAAMDRQHPRDLFDVKELFANEGITPDIRRAFVVYLACHNRSTHAVLFPKQKNIAQEYEQTFQGMTSDPVTLAGLESTRERLAKELQHGLDPDERAFLISLANAEPDWSLLAIPHLEYLSAIRWKLENLRILAKKNRAKFQQEAAVLEKRLTASEKS